LEHRNPVINWKIGAFQNVFPLFVCDLRPGSNKIEFRLSIRRSTATLPPVLHLRETPIESVDGRSEFVRLEGKLVEAEDVDASKFDQFVFVFDGRGEEHLIDFVGISAGAGSLELRSLEIQIV
jgi:hypothetical protein